MMRASPCGVLGCPCENFVGHEASASSCKEGVLPSRLVLVCEEKKHDAKCKDIFLLAFPRGLNHKSKQSVDVGSLCGNCILMQSWFAPVPDMVLTGTVLPGLQAQGRAAHDKSQRIRWRSSVRSPKSSTPFADGVGNCTLRFPDYWQNHDGDFNELIPMTGFQDVHASSTICVHAKSSLAASAFVRALASPPFSSFVRSHTPPAAVRRQER